MSISLKLALLMGSSLLLSGCQTMPGAIPAAEFAVFTPLPPNKRVMNEVALRWDVREDASKVCARAAKMTAEAAFFTPPVACAIWNKEKKECVIVTPPVTSHVALGHELRHCFEGHFH